MINKYSMAEQLTWPENWEDARASEFLPTVKFMAQFTGCAMVIGSVFYMWWFS